MALATIASAEFGMDFSWRAKERFTAVCAGLEYPHWWLRVLQIFYTALDHAVPQVVQNAMKGARKWLTETTHRFTDIPIIGVVMAVILAVGCWIFEELVRCLEDPLSLTGTPEE